MEWPPCPSCGSREHRPVVSGQDRLHGGPGDFAVVKCGGCALLFTCPRPDEQSLAAYYPKDYEPHAATEHWRPPEPWRFKDRLRLQSLVHRFGYGHLDVSAAGWVTRAMLPLIRRPSFRLPEFRGLGRALDVGCGAGSYLWRLRTMGWNVQGLDPAPAAVAAARAQGLTVFQGTVDDFAGEGAPFDLIRLASVLEHLPDPVGSLNRLRQWLSPEGRVELVVPCARSISFWFFRSEWFPLDLPRHLIHFTPRTLARVAQQAGFEIERITHDSGPRGWQRSLAYRWPALGAACRRGPGRAVLSALARVLDLVHLGDSLHVTLK